MQYEQNFSNYLKILREETLLSQIDFANRLGVSSKTISDWEQGTRLPRAYELIKICEIYKLDMHVLLGMKYQPHKEIVNIDQPFIKVENRVRDADTAVQEFSKLQSKEQRLLLALYHVLIKFGLIKK